MSSHNDEQDEIAPTDGKQLYAQQEDVEILDKNNVQDMTAEDRATALKLALAADPGIPVKSLRMVKMTLCMLVVCMCGGDAGMFHLYMNH